VPLLLVGAVTDLLNITWVLVLLAALVGGVALASEVAGRELEKEEAEETRPRERVHS
jgi:hypothetical protein